MSFLFHTHGIVAYLRVDGQSGYAHTTEGVTPQTAEVHTPEETTGMLRYIIHTTRECAKVRGDLVKSVIFSVHLSTT